MKKHSSRLPSAVRRIFELPKSSERVERELSDEMRIHIDMRVDELRALGISEADARAEALRRFGDEEEFRAYVARRAAVRARRYGTREWFGEWHQDLRFALRLFRKHAALTLLVVFTLALGIGANTAIFSVVHRILIAPLPYQDGDRIVMLATEERDDGFRLPSASSVNAWRTRAHSLELIAAVDIDYIAVQDPGERDSVPASVTSNYLRLLGIAPVIGRDFTPEDERPGSPRVAMVSYGLWQRVYGGRADVLGKPIVVSGRTDNPHIIIGVAPPSIGVPISFNPPGSKWREATPSIWIPASFDSLVGRSYTYARLRPGVSAARASAELQSILESMPAAPDESRPGTTTPKCCARAVRPQDVLDPREARTIEVLFVAVAVLLLIACANVANLLMARAWTRRREFAVRIALGAGRGRLTRLVLTESVLLALAGGVFGVALAWATLHVVVALRPPALENLDGVRVEPAVLLWCVAVSVFTGLLFGSAPALLSIAASAGDVLKSESRGSSGDGHARRIRSALIVGEIALSLVLPVGAGLLVRSFVALQHTPLGFDPRGLASVQVIFHRGPRDLFPGKQKAVLERLRAIPGVTDAAIGVMPGEAYPMVRRLESEADATGKSRSVVQSGLTFMSPTYFRVARMSLLEGRVPDVPSEVSAVYADGPLPSPPEVVINRSAAEALWPHESAVGKRVHSVPAQDDGSSTVVGVVDDTRMPGPRPAIDAEVYWPPVPIQTPFVVRSVMAPVDIKAALSRAVLQADPGNIVYRITIGETYMRDAMAPTRFAMALLATFSGVALLLSAVGLYGVIAYAVTQRTREIGIRLALGAAPRSVTSLVVRSGMHLTVAGVLLGIVAAVGSTRVLGGMLYGVSPGDPTTFAAIVALVAAIALAASYIPARRAANIDPTEALRAE